MKFRVQCCVFAFLVNFVIFAGVAWLIATNVNKQISVENNTLTLSEKINGNEPLFLQTKILTLSDENNGDNYENISAKDLKLTLYKKINLNKPILKNTLTLSKTQQPKESDIFSDIGKLLISILRLKNRTLTPSEIKNVRKQISTNISKSTLSKTEKPKEGDLYSDIIKLLTFMGDSKLCLLPKNCFDVKQTNNTSTSGVKSVYPFVNSPTWGINVLCDQETDGGGWTVFQTRDDLQNRELFNRSWVEYSLGFGNFSGEFWLGLENIHALTSYVIMELRVDMEDALGVKKFAKYDVFNIGNSQEQYKLKIGKYSGNSGDSLFKQHDQVKFSTNDQDNDGWVEGNCAQRYPGGWWYSSCYDSNLNGMPLVGNMKDYGGIIWQTFRGAKNSLKRTSMMIRPKFFNEGL